MKRGTKRIASEFVPRTTRLLASRTRCITDASVMLLFVRTSRLQETERQGEKETVLEEDAMMPELLGGMCSIIDREYGSTDVAKVALDLSSLLSEIFVL